MIVRRAAALVFAILLPFVVGLISPELAFQSGAPLALAKLDRSIETAWMVVFFSVPVLALVSLAMVFVLRSHFPRPGLRQIFWLPVWGLYAMVAMVVAMTGLDASVSWGYDRYQPILVGSTTFAPGFDDVKFRLVTPGTDVQRVIQLVGPPLREFGEEGDVVYVFSDIGHYRRIEEKAFHQRWVRARGGKVVRVYRRYLTTDQDPLS